MKKIALYLTLTICFGWSFQSFAQSSGYEITCNIEGAEGVIFTLQQRVDGRVVNLDSATVVNGMFKIAGAPIAFPDMFNLNAKAKRKGLTFFLENSKINITAKLDSLNRAIITGSKTQDEFTAFSGIMNDHQKKMMEQVKSYQKANQEGDTAKMSASKRENTKLSKEMVSLQTEFIKQHPESYVSPLVLGGLARNLKPEEVESLLNALHPNVAKVPAIAEIKAGLIAQRAVAIGQKAPDFTLNDPDGVPVALSAKIGSKLLLIDFWAAWCAPCRAENPNVVKAYQEFHEKGFDILGVSLDRNKGEWLKAIADDKLNWTQVSDLKYFSCAAAKIYAVNSIPANFLLDEKGTIVARNLRGEALYNKVKELLSATK